jgi:hypothetical protein
MRTIICCLIADVKVGAIDLNRPRRTGWLSEAGGSVNRPYLFDKTKE